MINSIPVWKMVKEAVKVLAGETAEKKISHSEIKEYINQKYSGVNPSTVNCQIAACTVNRQSRVNWPENKKARISNGQYDFLFSVDRGVVEFYDSERHGIWGIVDRDECLVVRKISGGDNDFLTPARQLTHARSVERKLAKPEIKSPCHDEVDRYLMRWDSLENYVLQESALDKLFFKTYPQNTDINEILIKVASLNDFYSTNIFAVFPIAKHIFNLKIDERIKNADDSLVTDIACIVLKSGKVKHFYSFATKYCSHHNPLAYPIYDSYVDKILRYFRDVDGFSKFKNDSLKDYPTFKSILKAFQHFYLLEDYNLKDIDRYLWQLGKDAFPKNYSKQKKNYAENG